MGWRSIAREAAAKAIGYAGLPRAARYARRKRATNAFYHDPSPAVIDKHLGYLRERFSFTTLDVIVDVIRSGSWSAVPELVLTFGDGHSGNYDLLPIFRRYGVRPTI